MVKRAVTPGLSGHAIEHLNGISVCTPQIVADVTLAGGQLKFEPAADIARALHQA